MAAVPALGAALMAAAGAQAATISDDGFSYTYTGNATQNKLSVVSDGNPPGELSFIERGVGLTITAVPASCTLPVPIRADCDDLAGDAGHFINLGNGDDVFAAPGGEVNARTYFAVSGGEGADTLYGGVRQDNINGQPGNDLIGGDPKLSLSGSKDFLDGSDGVDTVSYDGVFHAFSGVTVNLATGSGGAGDEDDELSNFENILGSKGPDRLIGDSGPNRIEGLRGKDVYRSGGGNDVIVDPSSKSTVNCGPGKDRVKVVKASKVRKSCEKVRFFK